MQAENVDLHSYERPLAVSPFGTPEHVRDWDDTHAMTLETRPQSRLGKWTRTDLGVRTFQGLGKNSPSREQVARRITRDLHSQPLIESLDCELQPQVPLRRRCLPGCGYSAPATRDTETCFMYRIYPLVISHPQVPPGCTASLLPSGGGGSPSFSKFGTSVHSITGTETLLSMQQLIENAEKECEDDKTELDAKRAKQGCVTALRQLFQDFEAQLKGDVDQMSISSNESDEQAPEQESSPVIRHSQVSNLVDKEEDDELNVAHNKPSKEPQLYLYDDWIRPVEVMRIAATTGQA